MGAYKTLSPNREILDLGVLIASYSPMKTSVTSLIAISLFALVLSACSKPESGGSMTTYKPSQFASDEFAFNNGAEPETLDPHRITAHDAAITSMQMFEGLLTREMDYLKIKLGLAESWSVSPDGKVYKFVLRNAVKWSNGEPITVEQVRASFVRALSPEVASQYMYWYTDYIVGAKELNEAWNKPNRKEVEAKYGVRITGPKTVEIELIKPVGYFKYMLSQPTFAIVHPSMFDPSSKAWTDPSKYIVNSAYNITEWSVNQRITLQKNPQFYDAANVKLNKIFIYPIRDESTVMNMYTTGKLDWTGDNHIASHMVPSLRGRDDFHQMPILGTYMYEFNLKRKPLDDSRVRRALSLVVDREHIVEKVLRGGQVSTDRIVPPVIPDFQSLIPAPASMDDRVVEAKKLLAEAGYSDVSKFPSITIRYNTNEGHNKVAQSIQQMWKTKLGIDVKLENMEWKVFLKEQQAGNFDVSRKGWIGDYPDPATFLEIFQSTSENNDSNWKNVEYDQLVAEAAGIQDEAKRFAKEAKAEKILYDETPAFGIYHYSYYSLMKPNVKGYIPNVHGHYLYRYFSKEGDQKS